MGVKDTHTNNYFDDNKRFADFINGSLNEGRALVGADELENVKEFYFVGDKTASQLIPDVAKLWKKKKVIFALYCMENLSYVDYASVIRSMQTESMGYRRQWLEKSREHKRKGDLRDDEFLSGISREDRFYPVIPIIVYYGTERRWDAKNTLYDFLGDDIPEELKKYVTNYRINLFDFHDYDSFDMFKTEVKTLFEFLRYSDDKDELYDVMEKNSERYSEVDRETGLLIKVLTKNGALEKYVEENKKIESKEGMNMCKAFEDYRAEGKMEGKIEGKIEERISLIRKKYNKHMSVDEIAELFELDLDEVKDIVQLITDYPQESDTQLAVRLGKAVAV